MNIVEITKPDWPYINLYAIGDLHIGDRNCDYKSANAMIDKAAKDPYAVVLGMGDWLNVATKQSVGKAVFDQNMDTTEQMKLAKKMFAPVKDKLIGLLEGNHEFRLSKEGICVTDILADNLETEYLGYSVVINISVAGKSYSVYATHGHGGGGTKGGVINKLSKLSNIVIADVYLRGHSHQLLEFKEPIRLADPSTNRVVEKIRRYVDTGSYLTYDDSYAEQANYTPSIIGSPIITFSKDGIKTSL